MACKYVQRIGATALALVLMGALLTGCAAPTPVVVEKERVVEKPVVQTVVVEKEKEVEKPVVQTVVVEKEKEVVVTATPVPVTTIRLAIESYIPQGIPFDKMVEKFERTHPYKVEVVPVPHQQEKRIELFNKTRLEAQQQKSSFDIIVGVPVYSSGAMFARGELLLPLDDLMGPAFMDDILDPVKKEVTFVDGKHYIFPMWVDELGFIYRPSLLQESMGTDKPPETWDEVLDYCEKIQAYYDAKGETMYAFAADYKYLNRFPIGLFKTLIEDPYDERGVIRADTPEFLEMLKLIKELYAYMPPNAGENMGGSKSFQAGTVVMEAYWQTQLLRFYQAGGSREDAVMVGLPCQDYCGTSFWTTGTMIPKYSQNVEGAVAFIKDALLDPQAIEYMFANWKIVPFKSALSYMEKVPGLPEWAPPLIDTMMESEPIPMNGYWDAFENPVFIEEIDKMVVEGQSPEQTQKNIVERFEEGYQEVQ